MSPGPWPAAGQQTVAEKVAGFGGIVLQGSPSLCLVAFGLPQTLEQLPQRAVQAALAIRHLAAEAQTSAGQAAGPMRAAGGASGHAAGRRGDQRTSWALARGGRDTEPCRCGCLGMRRRGRCWCPRPSHG